MDIALMTQEQLKEEHPSVFWGTHALGQDGYAWEYPFLGEESTVFIKPEEAWGHLEGEVLE